jgi:hypothetical protein
LERRFAEPIKELYPDRNERDKIKPDFHLSFSVNPEEISLGMNQLRINKVPEGLSGYDVHVITLNEKQ